MTFALFETVIKHYARIVPKSVTICRSASSTNGPVGPLACTGVRRRAETNRPPVAIIGGMPTETVHAVGKRLVGSSRLARSDLIWCHRLASLLEQRGRGEEDHIEK